MNTDRELLELAAKAVGYAVDEYCPERGLWANLAPGHWKWWNPLTDDGDALRLAVRLELTLYPPTKKYSKAGCQNDDASIDITEEVGTCSFKATRRAIVRAAAEIGKAMP